MKLGRTLCVIFLVAAVVAACSSAPGEREFHAGVREFKKGQFVRARALLEKSIQARPASDENAVAYNYIGLCAARLGLTPAAIEAFENSRRLSPALPDPAYNLGLLLAAPGGDAARAARALNEAALLEPSDPRALECLGDLYIRNRQWPEARRALYAALNRAPQSERILTAIARVEAESGDADQAVVTLLRALEQNSRYAPALFNLGVLYETRLKNAEQAIGCFEKFLNLNPDRPAEAAHARAAIERLRGTAGGAGPVSEPPAPPASTPAAGGAAATPAPAAATADDMLKQAERLAERGKTLLALEVCLQVAGNAEAARNTGLQERALRTAARSCYDQPRAHYELGRFLLAQKKSDAALKSFKQATVLDAKFTAAQIAMAEAAVQAGEPDAALSGLKQAVQSDPKSADALHALAVLYDRSLDLPEKAASTYADFAQRFGNDPRAAAARARAQELSPAVQFPRYTPVPAGAPSGPVTARVVAASAVEPRPPARTISYKRPDARNTRAAVQAFNRGNYYQQQGQWDDAIQFYLRSLESDDQLAGTWYNLGTAYTVKRDFDLAKDAFLRALALQSDRDDARYNLALIYREQNDPAAAIALLKDVLKNQPQHAAAHYVLGYLYADNASTIPLAKQHYQEFLRLAPKDPSARAVQQWLAAHP